LTNSSSVSLLFFWWVRTPRGTLRGRVLSSGSLTVRTATPT
jgi:hypothetical protein